MNINKNEKWLLVSCLQKSIRKGFEDIACLYAGQLYEIDKNYLIHVMRVILLEDIFLANTTLMNDFYIYSANKNHKKIEIINFIRLLSQSAKDRTAYNLLKIIKVKELEIYEKPEEILMNENSVIVDKIQCAKQILKKFINKNPLSNDIYHIEKILDNYHITNNKNLQKIIKNIYSHSKDSNVLLLGFLQTSYEIEKSSIMGNVVTGQIINIEYKPELLNNRWLIDGIDWHTKEGKNAIEDFSKENSDLKKYLMDIHVDDNLNIIIGLLLFKSIGEEVNKRLFYPSAVMAAKLSKKLELEKMIKHKNFDQKTLFDLFKKDYPLLKSCIEEKFKMPDPGSFPF